MGTLLSATYLDVEADADGCNFTFTNLCLLAIMYKKFLLLQWASFPPEVLLIYHRQTTEVYYPKGWFQLVHIRIRIMIWVNHIYMLIFHKTSLNYKIFVYNNYIS